MQCCVDVTLMVLKASSNLIPETPFVSATGVLLPLGVVGRLGFFTALPFFGNLLCFVALLAFKLSCMHKILFTSASHILPAAEILRLTSKL